MAYTISGSYTKIGLLDLYTDIENAYDWYDVQHNDENNEASFYVNENIGFRISHPSTNYPSVSVIQKSSTKSLTSGSNSYLFAKLTKTSKTFCLSFITGSASGTLTATSALNHIIVGTGLNPLTGEEEPVLAALDQLATAAAPSVKCMIVSSDNLYETIEKTGISCVGLNKDSKVTTMQNIFYKGSAFVMKDAYILTSLQPSGFAFCDCIFNGKKYYMQAVVMLADD